MIILIRTTCALSGIILLTKELPRKAPKEDPILSNIRERLKFGNNYDPNDSHRLAYSSSRDEIALFMTRAMVIMI